jgi:hypothetical protein
VGSINLIVNFKIKWMGDILKMYLYHFYFEKKSNHALYDQVYIYIYIYNNRTTIEWINVKFCEKQRICR